MSAKKKSQKSVSEGPPKFWDNQRNQLISAVVGGVVVGLTLASATQLAPYVYQVFVTRKQNAVETRFQEALDRTNDVYVGTMPGTDDKTVTNADGNIDRYTRPVGFITQIGPSSSAALMLIAPRKIDNLNLPRWNRPFSEN